MGGGGGQAPPREPCRAGGAQLGGWGDVQRLAVGLARGPRRSSEQGCTQHPRDWRSLTRVFPTRPLRLHLALSYTRDNGTWHELAWPPSPLSRLIQRDAVQWASGLERIATERDLSRTPRCQT
eukprot:6555377-Pyramimonas_sp.AAC.1